MLKHFYRSRLFTISLLFIGMCLIVYTVSQAAYWNETRRTEHGREGNVYDYDLADEGGASAYASVSKNYENRTVVRTTYHPQRDCPISSQCEGCSACKHTTIEFVRQWGTQVDTSASVSCSAETNGRRSKGSWSLTASEHQQEQIGNEVRDSTYKNHSKGNFYKFQKPDDLTGKAYGSISPAWGRVNHGTYIAVTDLVEF
ncbi:MAG: hypothetical protein OXU23_17460 [Candidatus Poribacteria bacterium]|nr:hypothetical protein [Candidatus Poribacteria bacterium]